MGPKNFPQNEPGPKLLPTLPRKRLPESPKDPAAGLLINQLLTLARVVIDLVERQETAADPVCLGEVEIAALVLRDYGDRKLLELKVHRAMLSREGIELDFQTGDLGQGVSWSLKLTHHKPGSSDPRPRLAE